MRPCCHSHVRRLEHCGKGFEAGIDMRMCRGGLESEKGERNGERGKGKKNLTREGIGEWGTGRVGDRANKGLEKHSNLSAHMIAPAATSAAALRGEGKGQREAAKAAGVGVEGSPLFQAELRGLRVTASVRAKACSPARPLSPCASRTPLAGLRMASPDPCAPAAAEACGGRERGSGAEWEEEGCGGEEGKYVAELSQKATMPGGATSPSPPRLLIAATSPHHLLIGAPRHRSGNE
ncbi:unnamed protein product [Closterium sp. NIES-64]|nr:unnamed protein product [Closterium sp. NIES-64]